MKSFFKLLAYALGCLFTLDLSAQNWEIVSYNDMPANYEIQSISVASENVVWIVADSLYDNSQPIPGMHRPRVMHTINGGLSWDVQLLTAATGRRAISILGLDANTALISTRDQGTERFVFKTTDGGVHWQQLNTPTLSGGLALHFFDAKHGLAVNRYYIATTEDAGETWTQVPTANIPALGANERNLFFNAGNFSAQVGDRVWLGTSEGRVMRTLDRGHHWEIYQAAGTNENVISVAFSDSLHGVVVVPGTDNTFYDVSRLFSTEDGGKQWTEMPPAPMGLVSTAVAVPGALGRYFIGDHLYVPSGSAYQVGLNTHSLDASAWDIQIDSFPLNAGQFISPSVGFMAGYSVKASDTLTLDGITSYTNVIYKWKGNLTGLAEQVPTPSLALNISPNPATDQIKIGLPAIELPQDARLMIMDADGRTVYHDAPVAQNLDIHDLIPGIYVIWLITDTTKVSGTFIKN